MPLVTREGTEVQIKEALARKPGATLRVEDIVDDSIVSELEKSGFIDKVYQVDVGRPEKTHDHRRCSFRRRVQPHGAPQGAAADRRPEIHREALSVALKQTSVGKVIVILGHNADEMSGANRAFAGRDRD